MLDNSFGRTPEPASSTPASGQSAARWNALTRAAYELDESRPVPPLDGRQLAEVIAQHAVDRAYYAQLERGLVALAAELAQDAGPTAAGTRRHVSELTSALRQELLRTIIGADGDATHRRQLLDHAAAGFPVDALLRVLVAAAAEADRELSRPLLRLLYKLAVQTRTGPPELRLHAERALRGQIESLVARWWAVQQGAMTFGFEDMFGAAASAPAAVLVPEPDRMVLMALEVDAVGMPVWGPITHMVGEGRFRELLELLRDSPPDSPAAHAITGFIATPQRLSALLAEEDVDFDAVDRLLAWMGDGAATALLDRLATAESRTARRGIFDRLVRLGPQVAPLAFDRLEDERWFVQRNILALLGELRYWPDGTPADTWLRHADPRLRREAVRALLRMPKQRERVILHTLRDDTDRQTLRLVLSIAREHTSEAAVSIIVRRLGEGRLPPDLEVAAVRVLRNSRSAAALEALLGIVSGGRSMLGRPKLAPKSSAMLTALAILADNWPEERRARPILERARASGDADIAAAAAGGLGWDAPPATDDAAPAIEEPDA